MALSLTGIGNENEFYTHHYLSAILENDLKNLFSVWQKAEEEQEIKPPYAKLSGIIKEYFILRARMEKAKDTDEVLSIQNQIIPSLLECLGYVYEPAIEELDTKLFLPIVAEIRKKSGEPELWIIEAACPIIDPIDPLDQTLSDAQYQEAEKEKMILSEPLSDIITKQVFSLSEPPRWIILISFNNITLLDRSKWNEKRYLSFDLQEIFGRREQSTLRAMAALLHKDSVCPDDGMPLLDTLDENSHKHAFAVSEDLKYSAREAVELLGNEAIYYLRNVLKEGIYGKEYSEKLTAECLRYLYRLLFLFYIEARPELGYAPMKSDPYRTGYSLESLRELEMIPLTTEESKNGVYIHESLKTLFKLVFDGFRPEQLGLAPSAQTLHHTFDMMPLKSHLFDPAKTPLLNRVRFRNTVLQRVIELLSLSRPKSGNHRRGRISYAQLGISQLGAVYEGLLSYSGFFAETDLYEVKKADAPYNELDTAFFVKAEDLTKYEENEKVYNTDGTLRMYPKGTFIYRLAGRNREKSASYYTPEVLTQCLVKYALKELLKDKTADEILKLTVCEPAMGNGSFLNETINQMAEAYLQLKQKETGHIIGHDEYMKEKQKVKAYIADYNVFGVDLNPTAVELAEVSLWLNTIYEGAIVPWFGMQLVNGNSLIGARRQVFESSLLETNKKGKESWLDVVPERVRLPEERKPNTIYHFLLPDSGMADYNDKVIKAMAKKEIETIKKWRKDFIMPYEQDEIKTLIKLSDAVDRLWERHLEQQQSIRLRTNDVYSYFGQEVDTGEVKRLTTQEKDKIFQQELLSENVRNSSPYRRLKLVMDYWCSLWFWPIEKADLLPSKHEFLLDISLILEGTVYSSFAKEEEQINMFPETASKEDQLKLVDQFGFVDVDKLCREIPRLKIVRELGEKYHFLHWELEFADLFAERDGFDLVVGNPPWIKVEWNEGGMMSDYEPLFAVRKYSAAKLNELREETLESYGIRTQYLDEFSEFAGVQNFLNGFQNYPLLKGMQTNLYKCFLPASWFIASETGVQGFLHPEGVYDDPNGGKFRVEIYPRLRYHFQFQNELNLFGDVDHHAKFSVNIFRYIQLHAVFDHIANLYAPGTIDACYAHGSNDAVPGIKDEDGKWNIRGHSRRVIETREDVLSVFARLYDEKGTPSNEARLPALHSTDLLSVLRKYADAPRRLGDLADEYWSLEMWHETNAQKDGTIKRDTMFPSNTGEWILSGPHFYVGNPLNKTPRAVCTLNSHYDTLDLNEISEDYLPRSNYSPACDAAKYVVRTPDVPWDDDKPKKVNGYYRLLLRGQLSQSGERTLIPAIQPKSVGHVHAVRSVCFKKTNLLLFVFGLFSSIPADFFIKSTGMSGIYASTFAQFPLATLSGSWEILISLRSLTLNCLTTHYSELWEECWDEIFKSDRWAKNDPRLDNNKFANLTPKWQRNCALRTDYERRQALVEIDVLAAMALGLTLEELCTIYRIQFPVLRQNENDTWYDQNGRIVFTCSKGLPGVGFSRPEWNDIKDMQSGTVSRTIMDDTMPGGPKERTITYIAPFDKCDREKDYATAWAEFEKRLKNG
jgi:hypothetical protein